MINPSTRLTKKNVFRTIKIIYPNVINSTFKLYGEQSTTRTVPGTSTALRAATAHTGKDKQEPAGFTLKRLLPQTLTARLY
jgi:hypothetical protein